MTAVTPTQPDPAAPTTASDDARADGPYEYAAFISYRHSERDRRWAKWLHKTLETYRVPEALQKSRNLGPRIGRVFRDEDELPVSSNLSGEIDKALQASKYLIVICSRDTPSSKWVNREVERFRELGRNDRILAILVDGEPHESFPKALTEIRRTLTGGASSAAPPDGAPTIEEVEPLAADVRPVRHESRGHLVRMARLRMIACVLGVRFDDLRNREQHRRNRRLVVLATVALSLLACMSLLTVYAFVQRRNAIVERDNAKAVLDFLTDEVLAGASPDRLGDAHAAEAVVRAVIKPATQAVGRRFADKPLVEAAIRHTLSQTLDSIGQSGMALEQSKAALDARTALLGVDHPDRLASLAAYASILRAAGRPVEAEPPAKEALDRRRRVRGPDHPETLESLGVYAMVLRALGRPLDALPLFKEAADKSRRNRKVGEQERLLAQANYASALRSAGRAAEAEPLVKDVFDRRWKTLGPDHPDTMQSEDNVARVLDTLGRPREADGYTRDVLERRWRVLGPDHANTISSSVLRARVLEALGKYDDAESLYEDAAERAARKLGPANSRTIGAMTGRAGVLLAQGQTAEAHDLARQAYDLAQAKLGEDQPARLTAQTTYALTLVATNAAAEAEPIAKAAADRRAKALGSEQPDALASLAAHVAAIEARRPDDALPRLADLHARRARALGADHPQTLQTQADYVRALARAGKPDWADPLADDLLRRRRKVLGDAHPETLRAMADYAAVLRALGRTADAAKLTDQAVKLSAKPHE